MYAFISAFVLFDEFGRVHQQLNFSDLPRGRCWLQCTVPSGAGYVRKWLEIIMQGEGFLRRRGKRSSFRWHYAARNDGNANH